MREFCLDRVPICESPVIPLITRARSRPDRARPAAPNSIRIIYRPPGRARSTSTMAPTEEDAAASAMARLEVTNGADDAAAAAGDDDGDASGDDDVADDPAGAPSAAAKKKKKKKKKKKTGGGGERRRGLGRRGQTAPPSIPVSKLFNGVYPEGEIQRYKDDNLWRETNEEKRGVWNG